MNTVRESGKHTYRLGGSHFPEDDLFDEFRFTMFVKSKNSIVSGKGNEFPVRTEGCRLNETTLNVFNVAKGVRFGGWTDRF